MLCRQRFCQPPEKARELTEGRRLQVLNACIWRNVEYFDRDNRARVDPPCHHMDRCAERCRSLIDREMRRNPARIVRRPRVKIIRAETEGIENSRRYNDRCDERYKPSISQDICVDCFKVCKRLGDTD